MVKSYFLMAIFVALTLPCVEVPEWVTMCNDPSNDFFLILGSASGRCYH